MRSLADDLRNRSGEQLAQLLRARPDVLEPIPTDISELAAALSQAASVRIAVDGLDALHLEVLRAVCLPDASRLGELTKNHSDVERLDEAIARLWSAGLLWGSHSLADGDAIRPVTAVAALVIEMPPRSGDLPASPAIRGSEVSLPKLVDGQAATHALEAVTLISQVCELWSVEPAVGLRSGGIPQRAVARVSDVLGADEVATAFWIELSAVSNLVALDDFERPRVAPTLAYDTWRQSVPARQWADVAQAWLRDRRHVKLNSADAGAPLSSDTESPVAADLRLLTLRAMAELQDGFACDPDSLNEYLEFARPRVSADVRAAIAERSIHEAELLGIVVRGALSALGRALLEAPSQPERLAQAARELLPPLVEQFVSQTDLTVVVPGPPTPGLRQLLNACADLESTGGAFVYRFSNGSIQRAMRMAMSGAELLKELRDHSANELPQPLEYLIKDVDRSHHEVRVGDATSYVTAEEDFLDEVMSTELAGQHGLRRVAATVVVATGNAQEVVEVVRAMKREPLRDDETDAQGFAGSHRSAGHSDEARLDADDTLITSLVTALQRTNEAADTTDLPNAPDSFPRMPTAISSQILQKAKKTASPVWVGYANNAGSTSRRLVDVIAIVGGAISAFDHSTARICTLAVSRVTGAQLAQDVESRSESDD